MEPEKLYIDRNGKVQAELKIAIKENRVDVPSEFEDIKPAIINLARKISSSLNIKNYRDKQKVELNKQVYLDPEFKELWDRIKYQTTYSVDFSSEKLI